MVRLFSFTNTLSDSFFFFFFFNDTATTEIYTLSLHDALPISLGHPIHRELARAAAVGIGHARSEEHTSELQSRPHLVCRLLLEKKNKQINVNNEEKKKKIIIKRYLAKECT